MPLDDGRMMWTEFLDKYSPDGDWRHLYDAYLDGKMTPQEAAQFGADYVTGEKLLAIVILRLIDALRDMEVLKRLG